MSDNILRIYTDGACKGNPGPGGWGAVLMYKSHAKEIWGGELNTTNNRMELLAAIKALECVKRPVQIQVYSDSQYLVKGMNEWMSGWIKTGFKGIKNPTLWLRLHELNKQYDVSWTWVKAHCGNTYNELADELANRGVSGHGSSQK